MRCSCCDKELSDAEATAKFVEPDGSAPHRFVDMCGECRGWLPPDTRIVSRSHANKTDDVEENDPYHLGDGEEEWDDY